MTFRYILTPEQARRYNGLNGAAGYILHELDEETRTMLLNRGILEMRFVPVPETDSAYIIVKTWN